MLKAARKDRQLVTSDWQKVQQGIDGVIIREVLHVPRDHGVITEAFRPEWDPTGLPVVHVYQARLFPAAIGAWSRSSRPSAPRGCPAFAWASAGRQAATRSSTSSAPLGLRRRP